VLKVGLTGGMACGKSFVAAAFGKLGCYVLEADTMAHEVIAPGGEAYSSVVSAFGTQILDSEKLIDRGLLAKRVFGDAAKLELLNSLVHPAVRLRALRRFAEIGESDSHAIIIYVAAILIESGASREVDKIIVVSCTRAQQIERAMVRPGATEADVLARLERQMPLERKKEFADYIIDTSGEREDTLRQTALIYDELRRLAE
jgi:dephospho-CoA kinase